VTCVVVATDGSGTAEDAVAWGARMVEREGGRLVLVQVVPPAEPDAPAPGAADATPAEAAAEALGRHARELVGSAGSARVAVASEPARAIVDVAEDEHADVLVVGNAGMGGRKEFLLGNVPNRVSHLARCTVVIVNTAGPSVTESRRRVPRADEVDDAGAVDELLVGRAATIARVLAKYGVADALSGTHRRGDDGAGLGSAERAARLRLAFEELGPTFCKLGQVLSTRPDLLPPEFAAELATLLDHVPPLTEAEVVEVMEQELGVPWEDVFESIEPEPLAAGTIAQVHRARLATGERVVAKIQRPRAGIEIMRDIALLERIADRAATRPSIARVLDTRAIIDHLSSSLTRELDFRQEAANIERLRTILDPYPHLEVPVVRPELSTGRLLVMEEVIGGPLSDAPEGPARKEVARELVESYYRQVLTYGFFHADPHPGNLMWCDGRIYFLDCGMVGEVDPYLREQVMLLLLAFWQEDEAFLADVALSLSDAPRRPAFDVVSFRSDMGALVTRYRHRPMHEIQLGPMLQEMTQIAVRHEVPLPATLVLMAKALAQVQLAAAELDPDLDPFAVAGSFVAHTTLHRLQAGLEPQRILYETQKLGSRITRIVEALERVIGAREGPRLQLQVRGVERLEETLRRTGRLVALALGAAAAIVATTVTAVSPEVSARVPQVFGLASAVLLLLLLVSTVRSWTGGQ
jgi:predicted unusual protein kinase regulating ubiquinone biosynthesis (AarF/ABC1/UbiB family)/nucleotide-binding universal stress UspA family protein